MFWPSYSWEKSARYPLNKSLGRLQSRCGHFTLSGIELRSLGSPVTRFQARKRKKKIKEEGRRGRNDKEPKSEVIRGRIRRKQQKRKELGELADRRHGYANITGFRAVTCSASGLPPKVCMLHLKAESSAPLRWSMFEGNDVATLVTEWQPHCSFSTTGGLVTNIAQFPAEHCVTALAIQHTLTHTYKSVLQHSVKTT